MAPRRTSRRDRAKLSARFRPGLARKERVGRDREPPTRPRLRTPAIRSNRPLAPRLVGWFRRGMFRHAAYLLGGGLILWGGSRSLGIFDLRADQVSLVNTLLLVFAGCFLVFLASHEQAVERAFQRDRATG